MQYLIIDNVSTPSSLSTQVNISFKDILQLCSSNNLKLILAETNWIMHKKNIAVLVCERVGMDDTTVAIKLQVRDI